MGEIIAFYFFVGGFVCAVVGGYIASQKNRSAEAWAFICFFTGIIGIIAIAAVPPFEQKQINSEKNIKKEFPQAKIHYCSMIVFSSVSFWDDRDVIVGDTSFLVIDFERKQIVVGLWKARYNPYEQPYRNSFAFSDIVKVEVICDGVPVAATNSEIQYLNGAKHIAIRITANDASKPVHEITFYMAKEGGKKRNLDFDQAMQKVMEFHAYLDSAIQETGEGQSTQAEGGQDTPVSEQISQLWRLKQEGALTQEEFEKQKARLLES